SLLSASPFLLVYWLLSSLFERRHECWFLMCLTLGMLACLGARIAGGALGTPGIFTGAYAMLASARLSLVALWLKLRLGGFA
ncbi:ABC transporter ATP-binding protein, partial [Pseudomonas syringae pv. tagetis]